MQATLAAEPVLAADETPVNVLDRHAGLAEDEAGAPHVLVVRTPHQGLTWLRALGSRQPPERPASPRTSQPPQEVQYEARSFVQSTARFAVNSQTWSL